jgi:hypothetical protein
LGFGIACLKEKVQGNIELAYITPPPSVLGNIERKATHSFLAPRAPCALLPVLLRLEALDD